MKLKKIKIQFYFGSNVTQKENLNLMTLAMFVKATREGEYGEWRFHQLCKNAQELAETCKGKDTIPKEIKDQIRLLKKYYPFITPSIYGENGSKMKGYKFNGLASFDADVADNMDLLNAEYRAKMKERLMDIPNVVYVAISPSGGLKILMFITIFHDEKEFKQMYPIVRKYIEVSTGLTLDKATSAPNQNLFIPYDPEVLFDDDKYLLNREELLKLISESVQVFTSPPPGSDANVDRAVCISDDVEENLRKVKWYVDQVIDANIDTTASYKDWVATGFSFASLGEDARELWLRLCSLYQNFKPEECDAKFTNCLAKHDGRRNIGSFFWECENRYHLLPYHHEGKVETTTESPATKIGTVPVNVAKAAIYEGGETDNNAFLTPYLFSGIEECLPRLIKNVIQHYNNPRQKDIVALSLLNVLSGMFSNLKVSHFNKICHVNTCSIVVAPAGAGKGVLMDARNIVGPLDDYKYNQSLQELIAWKAEDEETRSQDPPMLRYFLMPLDSTNAAIINFMLASMGSGAIIETEMAVGNTIGKQWESVKTILLKNFHNENYDVNRKGAGLKRVPLHFGFTMTTTPHTALSMISHADGLLSRIIIYTYDDCVDFDDCTFDFRKAFENRDYIEKAGEYIKEMYISTPKDTEIIYAWSDESQKKLLAFFKKVRARTLKVFGNDFDVAMKRTALIASRFGAMFAFMNDYDCGNLRNELVEGIRLIPDYYVDSIIKLVNRTLWHSRTFYDNLEKNIKVIDSKLNKIYHILQFLPAEFKFQDLGKAFFDKVQISPKTLERRIIDCCELGFLEKVKHGHYRKTDKCPKI